MCHNILTSIVSQSYLEGERSMNPNSGFVKAMFATILTLLFVTLLDIFVIVYLWLPSPTTSFGSKLPWFWWIPFGFIQFFLPLAVSWLLNSRLALLNYLFFIFGIEDTLFYLIAHRTIPEVYHGIYYLGVFFAPPKHIVLVGNLVAVGLASMLVYGFKRNA
jgi:hypothetical protein